MTVLSQPLPFPDRRAEQHTPLLPMAEAAGLIPDKLADIEPAFGGTFETADEELAYLKMYQKTMALGQHITNIMVTQNWEKVKEELDVSAYLDVDTGLLNKRGFNLAYENILSTPNSTPAVIGFIDMDRFKALNEAHGHVHVDALVGIVAETMRKHLRDGDVLARYGGGDEFAFILQGIGLDQAYIIMQRLNKAVEAIRGTDNFDLDDERKLTLSVGITAYDPDLPKDDVLNNANILMKQAKEKHRAQGGSHIVADGMPPEPALV
jgi:diguanylate cyclase (GGDEF)-like protein